MKPVLLGVIFILAYGLFSMKGHAAEEEMSTGNAVFAGSGHY